MSNIVNPADAYFQRDRERENAMRQLGTRYQELFTQIENYRQGWDTARAAGFRADELVSLGFLSPSKLPKPKTSRANSEKRPSPQPQDQQDMNE